MSSLVNKQVIVGITGGIAAYKSAELVRRLQDEGARVRVVMTEGAQAFITPLTLQALSGNPVHLDLLDSDAEAAMGHIELAKWADLIVVAPATADFIARLANGEGDDLLTTLCLATSAVMAVAPAMNQAMWANSATQDNIALLSKRGIKQLGPASGSQACGDVGEGRMLEPTDIAKRCADLFNTGALAGKRVVITAGPTREAIDPVRYISNHSSGKMGYALATAAMEAGAYTTLISGPTNLPQPARCNFVSVTSAEEMHQASLTESDQCDIFIASAAVADYRPAVTAEQKIKKGKEDTTRIELVKNPDIVASISATTKVPFVVGFCAETENVLQNGRDKLARKGLKLIIANDVSNPNIGFNSDENAVTLIWPNREEVIDQQSKQQLARLIIAKISEHV
ncbi:bifunctional phosphopantothenoylcysteine decarboxylase/phosphopantothenate--cysteine ligase CoaBC [Aurantivibrio plasticivorans]